MSALRQRTRRRVETNPPWLISFADMMTLVLTFFVLLFSTQAVDQSVLSKIQLVQSPQPTASAKMPERVVELMRLIAAASNPGAKLDRIKEMLIPPEYLPPEVTRASLEANMKVVQHPEGLAILLSDKLLFAANQATLPAAAQRVLAPLAELLAFQRCKVSITGYVDPRSDRSIDPLELSGDRALAVLDFFIKNGLQQDRFSISGYGANAPWLKDGPAAAAVFGSRVEILLQTSPFFGGYQSF